MSIDQFWKHKRLEEMSEIEWESLCDRCALCCRLKEEDGITGAVYFTNIACRLLDPETCRCGDYENRRAIVPECIQLTPNNVGSLKWLPTSCAYRLLAEGKDLPAWHPLVTGHPESAHNAGFSVKNRVISETELTRPPCIDRFHR